jgi:hypothetical protein
MSVLLFKKGDSHIFEGVKCEMIEADPEHMSGMIQNGWLVDVNDLEKEKKKPEKKKKTRYNLKKIAIEKLLKLKKEIIFELAEQYKIENRKDKSIKILRNDLIILKQKLEK